MHRLALVLMILLLPLRGWAGDAMATFMATGQLAHLHAAPNKQAQIATETIAVSAHGAAAMSHMGSKSADDAALGHLEPGVNAHAGHDCQDLQIASSDDQQAGESNSADCGVCPSCQACHTVALSLKPEKVLSFFNPAAQPEAAALPFASADAALSQKPPIS